MTTKQQQKNEAYKAFKAIVDPARKAYNAKRDLALNAIVDLAFKAYKAKVDLARNVYNAKCKEIDDQEELTVKDIN